MAPSMIIVMVVLQSVICAILSAWLASEKGRSGPAWFWIGLILSIWGLIAAAGMPARGASPAPAWMARAGRREDRSDAVPSVPREPAAPDPWESRGEREASKDPILKYIIIVFIVIFVGIVFVLQLRR